MRLYAVVKWVLFKIEPEASHTFSLSILKFLQKIKLLKLFTGNKIESPVTVMGLNFPNAVGLAAGLDKNGDYIDALCECGFGFIEVGTVTPKAQSGNQKPRLFRIASNQAIINRLGFNNEGVDYLLNNIKRLHNKNCVIGVNIGKNKDTAIDNAVDDYSTCFERVYAHADYVTVNISSPNTPGLRELQSEDNLNNLLEKLKEQQGVLSKQYGKYTPLVVKISPDLSDDEVVNIAQILRDKKMDGVIATNTTNTRPDSIPDKYRALEGGLSGAPLIEKSNDVLKLLAISLNGEVPIIAVGGIMGKEDVLEKLRLGASLVQIYTGFIYHGPDLIKSAVLAVKSA